MPFSPRRKGLSRNYIFIHYIHTIYFIICIHIFMTTQSQVRPRGQYFIAGVCTTTIVTRRGHARCIVLASSQPVGVHTLSTFSVSVSIVFFFKRISESEVLLACSLVSGITVCVNSLAVVAQLQQGTLSVLVVAGSTTTTDHDASDKERRTSSSSSFFVAQNVYARPFLSQTSGE